MKHLCPRCHQPGISGLQKRWASRAAPARCTYCHQGSYTQASDTSGIPFVGLILVVVAIIISAALGSYLPLIAGVCLAVAHNVWAWRRAELFPIPDDYAKAANAASWVVIAIGAILALFN